MKKAFLIFAVIFTFSIFAQAQTTAFNFQGRLNDGSSAANGRYDLQFILYDALVGGNQVGSIVTKNNQQLINGVFSTQLDFGANAFSGGDRFLEIQIRPNGSTNAYVILGARQQLLSVPYSVRSLNATNANNAQTAVSATNSANSSSLGGVAANNYLLKNGDGSQLTNVTAVNSQQLGGVAANQFVQRGGFGTVKAMAEISGNGIVTKCYNSTLTGSAATTVPCGITVNHFTLGGYGINFGFNAQNNFVSATVAKANGTYIDGDNAVIRYEYGSTSGNIDIRTAKSGEPETTRDYTFTVMIF